MPNLSQDLKDLFNLQPGDIIISEFPFEDAVKADFKAINSKSNIEPGHISIYTGDFAKPFAHSLQEGYKLPGVRLTKQWDGRHVIFRFEDPELAQNAAEIARRWAISTAMYDIKKFEKTYPKIIWSKQHEDYKKEYFSNPDAIVPGPATPYNLDRGQKQLSERARDIKLIKFRSSSLRRAIKFASRAELMQKVSKGLRCTSFVIGVYQAASLQTVVKKTASKFPFKKLNKVENDKFLNAVLINNWADTDIGSKLSAAQQSGLYNELFPDGFDIDSKYAIPKDIYKALKVSSHWKIVGNFVVFKDTLLSHRVDFNPLLAQEFNNLPILPLSSPRFNANMREVLLELRARNEELCAAKDQEKQLKDTKSTIIKFSTPVKDKSQLSQLPLVSSNTTRRKLMFD